MINNKIIKACLYLFLLSWPWQIKLILGYSDSAYLEISLFLSLLILIPVVILGFKMIILDFINCKEKYKKPFYLYLFYLLDIFIFSSIFWSENKLVALYHYLILLFGFFIFYVLRKKDFIKIEIVIKYFLFGLITPALLAIWQFFTQSSFSSKYLGLARHSSTVLGDAVIELNGGRFLRSYGSFDHPNILGAFMVIGILFIFYLSLNKEIGRNTRLFYLFLLSIFYLSLLFSFSRTALLALIISLPFLIFKHWFYGKFQKKIISFFLFLLFGISCVVIIPNHDLFFSRTQINSRLEKKSISDRVLYIEQSRNIISLHPLVGTGIGNYISKLKKVYPNHESWYYQPVHNYWILILAELGFFGLSMTLFFWFLIFRSSLRKGLLSIVIALFIFSLFDHWLWTQNVTILLFFLIAGMLSGEDV